MRDALAWGLVLGALWLLWAKFTRWVLSPDLRQGDPIANAAYRLIQVYARLVHRVKAAGRENVPARSPDGVGDRPMIVVSNHTAGVDPLLIQSVLPFEVRWVMASDMRLPAMEGIWRFARVIVVDRQAGAMGLREAFRHLKRGGTLGMFPEGGIERPARRLLPFHEGVGLLIARTGALVLPVIVDGTPRAATAWGSLGRCSRSSLRFLPVIDFAERIPERSPPEIAAEIRQVFANATGWPMNDRPAAPPDA